MSYTKFENAIMCIRFENAFCVWRKFWDFFGVFMGFFGIFHQNPKIPKSQNLLNTGLFICLFFSLWRHKCSKSLCFKHLANYAFSPSKPIRSMGAFSKDYAISSVRDISLSCCSFTFWLKTIKHTLQNKLFCRTLLLLS